MFFLILFTCEKTNFVIMLCYLWENARFCIAYTALSHLEKAYAVY